MGLHGQPSPPASPSQSSSLLPRKGAPTVALSIWLIGIGAAGVVLGMLNSSPGAEIPTTTWTAEAAFVGAASGLVLGLFSARRPRREHVAVTLVAGSAVYSLTYEIATAVGYGGGDSGGAGLVFVVIALVCLLPMGGAAAAAYAVRTAALWLIGKHGASRAS